MRHFLRGESLSIRLLASCMVTGSFAGLLVAAACRAERCLPRRRRASVRAVPVAPVAPAAQEEDLAAVAAAADDKAK